MEGGSLGGAMAGSPCGKIITALTFFSGQLLYIKPPLWEELPEP